MPVESVYSWLESEGENKAKGCVSWLLKHEFLHLWSVCIFLCASLWLTTHSAKSNTHTHTHTHLETASSVAFSQTSPACQGICLRRPHSWVEASPLCQMTGKAGSGFPPVDRGQTHAADGALWYPIKSVQPTRLMTKDIHTVGPNGPVPILSLFSDAVPH